MGDEEKEEIKPELKWCTWVTSCKLLLFMEMNKTVKETAIKIVNNQWFDYGHVTFEIFMRQSGDRDLKRLLNIYVWSSDLQSEVEIYIWNSPS